MTQTWGGEGDTKAVAIQLANDSVCLQGGRADLSVCLSVWELRLPVYLSAV